MFKDVYKLWIFRKGWIKFKNFFYLLCISALILVIFKKLLKIRSEIRNSFNITHK